MTTQIEKNPDDHPACEDQGGFADWLLDAMQPLPDPNSAAHRTLRGYSNRSDGIAVASPSITGTRSRSENEPQLGKEFEAGKLDGIDFQCVPADETQKAAYGFWRLDGARSTLE